MGCHCGHSATDNEPHCDSCPCRTFHHAIAEFGDTDANCPFCKVAEPTGNRSTLLDDTPDLAGQSRKVADPKVRP